MEIRVLLFCSKNMPISRSVYQAGLCTKYKNICVLQSKIWYCDRRSSRAYAGCKKNCDERTTNQRQSRTHQGNVEATCFRTHTPYPKNCSSVSVLLWLTNISGVLRKLQTFMFLSALRVDKRTTQRFVIMSFLAPGRVWLSGKYDFQKNCKTQLFKDTALEEGSGNFSGTPFCPRLSTRSIFSKKCEKHVFFRISRRESVKQ